ncbi:YqcC family protein [Shewanella sp. OMA3-2]|uniref:YqcC family protein n=1 Tax=Shewanella sp. OMA3-2 TaxID=2908650 RepID=UPI001F2B4987|nr:YqcC family protein [Shewanella sp. OMA3-2]UJF21151.1 YqcC family protein [Shewanella sp. OMA3-2]
MTFLVKLELQLKLTGLWSPSVPSSIALASKAPFACDTLAFEQWLQFIFIPKMQQLIDMRSPLPDQMAIAPMAQQVWQTKPEKQDVIVLLEQFDQLITHSK